MAATGAIAILVAGCSSTGPDRLRAPDATNPAGRDNAGNHGGDKAARDDAADTAANRADHHR